ncbi:MAG: hypothetical protein ACTS8S_21140 [Giesbergeria sp.]
MKLLFLVKKLSLPKHLFPIVAIASAYVFVVPVANAVSASAACLLVGAADLHELPDGSLTDSTSVAEQERYAQLTRESRERIASTFGEPRARPILVYFNDPNGLKYLKSNAFGTTHFIGPRACVMIGPKGQNIDVVSHELMHAEIHERVGYLGRFIKIPAWFDEGVAMQVDHRPQYDLSAEEMPAREAVRQLTSFSAFFSGDEKTVIANYAKARAVVHDWLAKVGAASLYERLDRMRKGESFAEATD